METESGSRSDDLRQQQHNLSSFIWAGDDVDEQAAQTPPIPPPPISGLIPSPTGGIHSYLTEDHLRHRSLTSSPPRRAGAALTSVEGTQSLDGKRLFRKPLLDDADVAAGASRFDIVARCSSEPRPSSNHLRNRSSSRTDILPTSGAYGGSEHDFLLLAYSHSIPEVDVDVNTLSYEGKPQMFPLLPIEERNLTIPSAVTDSTSSPLINKFVVLGFDLSKKTRQSQFLVSAGGTFCFSLIYGYLQELISVQLCNRKLGLFLAAAQFFGYAILSYFFRNLDKGVNMNREVGRFLSASPGGLKIPFSRRLRRLRNWGGLRYRSLQLSTGTSTSVPIELYVGLSVLRAIDLAMTNLAMQYVNYPAKTLMKSTRLVFTMLFGVIITKKKYNAADYGIVCLMVAGLALFMHADSTSSAVFQPVGVLMLTISLLGDGAVSNMSEAIMNKYHVGQDEFIFWLYSIALFFVSIAAAAKGDLRQGFAFLTTPGTLKEMSEGLTPTWSVHGKILTIVVFSTTGFLGSSCSAAITKSFGALAMSITSTARKATTIFLSFALFPNECTAEHIVGIVLFITSLVTKSLRASMRCHDQQRSAKVEHDDKDISADAVGEIGKRSNSLNPSLGLRGRITHLGHDAV